MSPVPLVIAFVAGLAVGAVYFAGLWVTVRGLAHARHPLALLASSGAVRLAVILAGFYWALDRGWQALLACLLGVLLARMAATRWARVTGERPDPAR